MVEISNRDLDLKDGRSRLTKPQVLIVVICVQVVGVIIYVVTVNSEMQSAIVVENWATYRKYVVQQLEQYSPTHNPQILQ